MTIDLTNSTSARVVLNLANQNQDLLKQVSIQIAGGKKYQSFKGFAEEGNVESFISFQASFSKTNTFIQSNEIIRARVDTTSQAISQLQDIASDVSNLIAQRRNSASGQNIAFDIQANSILDRISEKLNTQFDGRFVFAGTKTNTQPVQNIHTSNINSDGTPLATYYNGDSSVPSVKISDSQDLEYGILGNDISFRQLIGAVHLAIDGDTNNDDEKLGQAMEMINNAVSNLTSVRAKTLASRESLDQADAVHLDVSNLVAENLNKISETNIVDATTRMSELQATIQATYLAYTRLSGLRLANFLQ